MIEFRKVTKTEKEALILDGASFSIKSPGKIYTIYYDDEAQKDNLLGILFGLDSDFEGDYLLFDQNVHDFSEEDWHRVRNQEMQIVYQKQKLNDLMTVWDNLAKLGFFPEEEINEQLVTLSLEDVKHKRVSELSTSERMKLAIARSLLLKPKILLLDEPTNGLELNNIQYLMQYIHHLKAKGLTIIILSNNMSIIENSDDIFQFKNQKIVKIKSSDEATQPIAETCKKANIVKKTPYLQACSLLEAKKLENILMLIPVAVVFSLLFMLFSFQFSRITNRFERLFTTVTENTIVIDTGELIPNAQRVLLGKGTTSKLSDGSKLYFSDEDIDIVKNIKGVKSVDNTDKNLFLEKDRDGYGLNLIYNQDQLSDQIKDQFKYKKGEFYIGFGFKMLTIPKQSSSSFNPEKLTIIEGEYPDDNSNQILVPDIFIQSYFQHQDYNKVVGETVSFETVAVDNQLDVKKSDYIISGVYHLDTSNTSDLYFPIYVPWSHFLINIERDNLMDYYNSLKMMYNSSGLVKGNSTVEIFNSFEEFEKAYGSGYATMIIELESDADQQVITEELERLFPQYVQLSQYSFKNGTIAEDYQREKIILIGISSLVSLILGLLLSLFNRQCFKKHTDQLAIQFSLGYSRGEVQRILIYEHLILFYIGFVVAYILSSVIYLIHFKNTLYLNGINQLFNPVVIATLFYLVNICLLVALIWNVTRVKEKQLYNSLLGK